MFCIRTQYSTEAHIKKSRFIGVVSPCASEQEALRQLHEIYTEHPNANHIAFAYRIKTGQGISYRFHDAGEPSGTAGKPIFQHLEGKQLINLVLAVIRYFGGVKLGAGGLTRAYGNTAKQVIEAARLYPFIEMLSVSLSIDYQQMQNVEYVLKKIDGQIIKQEFAAQINLQIHLPAEQVQTFLSSFPAAQLP